MLTRQQAARRWTTCRRAAKVHEVENQPWFTKLNRCKEIGADARHGYIVFPQNPIGGGNARINLTHDDGIN